MSRCPDRRARAVYIFTVGRWARPTIRRTRTREVPFAADPASLAHDPGVVVEPAIRLAAGEGRNGYRYRGTADGEDLVPTHAELA